MEESRLMVWASRTPMGLQFPQKYLLSSLRYRSLLTLYSSQTLFGLGSCTKAFITTALGILIDEMAKRGDDSLPALTWETKLQDILPDDWKLGDKFASSEATLQDILS